MAKLILGVAGEMGSGKDAVSQYLVSEYKANKHNFSDILNDILTRLHLEITRENQAPLSLALRETFGSDILAKAMAHDSKQDENEIVVIHGIRRIEDMQYLKAMPNFKLIYIEVDMRTRFERVHSRNEKANDGLMTFEEFEKTHQYETEKTIANLKNYTDYIVNNCGTYNELHEKIDEIVKQNI